MHISLRDKKLTNFSIILIQFTMICLCMLCIYVYDKWIVYVYHWVHANMSTFRVTSTCLLVACILNPTYQVVQNACGFISAWAHRNPTLSLCPRTAICEPRKYWHNKALCLQKCFFFFLNFEKILFSVKRNEFFCNYVPVSKTNVHVQSIWLEICQTWFQQHLFTRDTEECVKSESNGNFLCHWNYKRKTPA